MLGKLLKYEMRSTSRVMWFLYGAVILVGTIIGIVLRVNVDMGEIEMNGYFSFTSAFFGLPEILLTIFSIIYVLLLVALAIMTIIMIILRFNNNLLKGEGYLMHTLPVPTWMLVLSKTIISLVWMIIGVAASVASVILLGLTSGMLPYIAKEEGIKWLWKQLWSVFGENGGLYIAAAVIGVIALILEFYFSMAVGNIANKHKFLLAVGVFIGLQIVISIVSTLVGNAVGTALMQEAELSGGVIRNAFSSILTRELILNAVLVAACFAGTTLILKKRLNLA